jgi:hypothetical protein
MTPLALDAPDFTRRYLNLADPRLGAEALSASDDFFAPKERLLNPEPAVFVPGKYDDHGKWMDGWETRRKRVAGHDWCIVRLGRTGVIKGVDLDTSHFTGNYPVAASIEACHLPDLSVSEAAGWDEILPATNLKGDPSPVELFYLATAGSAKVLGLGKTLGQLRDGFQADLAVWDPADIMPYGRELLDSENPKLVLSRLIYRGAKARLERILVNGCRV